MASDTERKRRGRPPKPASERRRHNQTFRIDERLREVLLRKAEHAQRSVSEEVEQRIVESLTRDGIVDAFGGEHTYALMRAFSSVIEAIERYRGRQWHEDAYTREQCRQALGQLQELLFSAGEPKAELVRIEANLQRNFAVRAVMLLTDRPIPPPEYLPGNEEAGPRGLIDLLNRAEPDATRPPVVKREM